MPSPSGPPRRSGWQRKRGLKRDPAIPALVGVSVVLLGCALWWGVPAYWAPDELTPTMVHYGIDQRFSGGWYDSYGPVLFYLLTPLFLPVRAAAAAGALELHSPATVALLQLLSRGLVLVMAIGTVLTVYVLGRDLWDRRTGVFAALLGTSILPFVFYAKLANVEVPYVFWTLLAIVQYGRIVREPRGRTTGGSPPSRRSASARRIRRTPSSRSRCCTSCGSRGDRSVALR